MIVLGSHPNIHLFCSRVGSAFSEENGPDTLQSCLIGHEANSLNVDVSTHIESLLYLDQFPLKVINTLDNFYGGKFHPIWRNGKKTHRISGL